MVRERAEKDPRSEPQLKQRVPYILSTGPPGSTLYSCVREPQDFVKDPTLRVNYAYYIRGQILPALNRSFLLVGQDVEDWLEDMMQQEMQTENARADPFLNPHPCGLCGEITNLRMFCGDCESEPDEVWVSTVMEAKKVERKLCQSYKLCMVCTGSTHPGQIQCDSFDCPVYPKRESWKLSLGRQKTLLDAAAASDIANAL